MKTADDNIPVWRVRETCWLRARTSQTACSKSPAAAAAPEDDADNDDVDLEDDDARKHQVRQIDRPCLHGADDGSVQSSSLEFRRSVHYATCKGAHRIFQGGG